MTDPIPILLLTKVPYEFIVVLSESDTLSESESGSVNALQISSTTEVLRTFTVPDSDSDSIAVYSYGTHIRIRSGIGIYRIGQCEHIISSLCILVLASNIAKCFA